MTCFAQGSRSSLSYIVESTFGTTPAGNFTNLPFSTHSLNLTKDRVAGNDIQADRMPRVDRHGNRQSGGDIVVDLVRVTMTFSLNLLCLTLGLLMFSR